MTAIKRNLIILSFLIGLSMGTYLLYGMDLHSKSEFLFYIISSRYKKLIALFLTAVCVGLATLLFQTVTRNRVLTPSIMGLDSIYVFIQTILLYLFGSEDFLRLSAHHQYLLSLSLMIGFSFLLFRFLFFGKKQSIYFVLLFGLIFNSLFGSLTSFVQMLIDPNDFLLLQSSLFASFNAINTDMLWLSVGLLLLSVISNFPYLFYLDVMLLGEDLARNLGLDYDKLALRYLLWSAFLVAIATALTGPVTFLGLLVVNLSYQIFATYKHRILIPAVILVASLVLILGQFVVQNLLHLSTPLSVVLNLVGGLYFLWLLVKESKTL